MEDGFISCILDLSRKLSINGSDELEEAIIHHWLHYCTTSLFHCSTQQVCYNYFRFLINSFNTKYRF